MVSINGNAITMTRGDTLRLQIKIIVDGEEYTPQGYDEVRFALKHQTMNATRSEYTDSEPLIIKSVPIDTLILTLKPSDTKQLGFGKYDYDVQITFDDGTVSTFISDTLKLTKEVD